ARLGARPPEQMPELRAERFVLVDGADDDLIAFCRNRDGNCLEVSFFLLFGGSFDLAMSIDHDLVAVARRDVDGAEVHVDDQSSARFGGAGFVCVLLSSRESGEGSETNEY